MYVYCKKTFFFPLIPRMQAYLICPALSTLMRWHMQHRNDDGIFKAPYDGKAWEMFLRIMKFLKDER